jgi:hypothetical protein
MKPEDEEHLVSGSIRISGVGGTDREIVDNFTG